MSQDTTQAPDFTAPSTAGGDVTLSDTLESGPTVILVNRGYWCSFCAEHLQTFSEVSHDHEAGSPFVMPRRSRRSARFPTTSGSTTT